MAVRQSPEIRFDDLNAGNASAPLAVIVRRSVGAALQRPVQDVAVSEARLLRHSDDGASSGLLACDLSFGFCATAELGELSPPEFEVAWRSEALQYTAFDRSTVRLVRLSILASSRENSAGGAATPAAPVLRAGNEQGSANRDPGGGGLNTGAVVLLSMCAVAALIFLALVALAYSMRRSRHLRKIQAAAEEWEAEAAEEGTLADEAGAEQQVLAHVTYGFSPTVVEDDKLFRDSCLELQSGDIVEVVAGGGGWLCGRLIRVNSSGEQESDEHREGAAGPSVERFGFFPENYVTWLGQLSDEGLYSTAEQHLLVNVERSFSPEDLQQPCEEGGPCAAEISLGTENMLRLDGGEVVQVLSGGGGWLYGCVAGEPDRAGYFPESCASPALGAGGSAEAGAAGSSPQSRLVQVARSFSPGSPGDAEEEVSFAEVCIALAEGDLVEVAASGGGWLYGRVVGAPERAGYFPETRVAWLSRPIPEGDAEGPAQDMDAFLCGVDEVVAAHEEAGLGAAASQLRSAGLAGPSAGPQPVMIGRPVHAAEVSQEGGMAGRSGWRRRPAAVGQV